MTHRCSHSIDHVKAARELYLSQAFTKLWSIQVGLRAFSREPSVCLHCYNIYSSLKSARDHAERTNHNLCFTIQPFGVLCWGCGGRFKSPKTLTQAAFLSLKTFPTESLPIGFANLGNSCYSNAVLIALSHCQPLVTAAAVSALPICKLFSAAATLNRSFNRLVPELMPKFSPFLQEDAAEFLLYVVDMLTDDFRVKELFTGKTTRHQCCMSCNHHSHCTQGFTVLPITLDDKGWANSPKVSGYMARSYGTSGVISVEETSSFSTSFVSLLQHGSTHRISLVRSLESLCRASPIVCEQCKAEDGVVFTCFSELPEILILQVARFGKRWFGLGKVHKMVTFPDLDVDFSHFVGEGIDCGPAKYNLTAVVFHTGFMDGGHYQCYARKNDRWYLFNDSSVSQVSRDEVLKCQGYLLFYTKIPPPDVVGVRFHLARDCAKQGLDFGLAVNVLSNPMQWIGKIPRGARDDLFEEASEVAGGDVLRDVVDDDKKARFVCELPFANKTVSVSTTATAMIWEFVTEKGPVPMVLNLEEEDGVRVVGTVEQFYVDPATLNPSLEADQANDGERDEKTNCEEEEENSKQEEKEEENSKKEEENREEENSKQENREEEKEEE